MRGGGGGRAPGRWQRASGGQVRGRGRLRGLLGWGQRRGPLSGVSGAGVGCWASPFTGSPSGRSRPRAAEAAAASAGACGAGGGKRLCWGYQGALEPPIPGPPTSGLPGLGPELPARGWPPGLHPRRGRAAGVGAAPAAGSLAAVAHFPWLPCRGACLLVQSPALG